MSDTAFSARQRESPLSRLASQVRKYNVVFVVADQEPHLLEHSVQGMARHYFMFMPERGSPAMDWCERLLRRHLPPGRDPSLELTSLGRGECFYIGPHGLFRVRVKREEMRAAWWWRRELEKKRMELEERRRRLIIEVGRRIWMPETVDETRVEEVARRHRVSKDKLLGKIREIDREELGRALREKNWKRLAELGLWDIKRAKPKMLGYAVLEYYGLEWPEGLE
ncbi:MAG: hypothetical protein DRJ56_06865 [Thermoprotei archaeon]|nr:MAG: hypothetical protein DRJ56_06865 [Thermoprotei archaeon]